MHVSMLAGLPPMSSAYSEHKARIATPFHQLFGGGVVERCSNAPPKAPTALQRAKLLTPDLRSGLRRELLESRFSRHAGSRDALRHGASLRHRLALFLGKAKRLLM